MGLFLAVEQRSVGPGEWFIDADCGYPGADCFFLDADRGHPDIERFPPETGRPIRLGSPLNTRSLAATLPA